MNVYFGISLAIVLLDQLTKILALKYLASYDTIPLISGVFHLSLVKNTGIAFGLFRNRGPLLIVVVLICLAALIALTVQMRDGRPVQRLSLAFILGGAIGNLIDRFSFGYVIDFLDFRIWPVFNLADSFITVGVCLFLFTTLGRK